MAAPPAAAALASKVALPGGNQAECKGKAQGLHAPGVPHLGRLRRLPLPGRLRLGRNSWGRLAKRHRADCYQIKQEALLLALRRAARCWSRRRPQLAPLAVGPAGDAQRAQHGWPAGTQASQALLPEHSAVPECYLALPPAEYARRQVGSGPAPAGEEGTHAAKHGSDQPPGWQHTPALQHCRVGSVMHQCSQPGLACFDCDASAAAWSTLRRRRQPPPPLSPAVAAAAGRY